MAKRSGLTFKDEQAFAKEWTPNKLSPTALKQIVEQLRTKNAAVADVKPALDPSKVIAPPAPAPVQTQEVKKAAETDKKLVEGNKKLNTNIEKLTKVMASAIVRNKMGANRAEEIAGKQQLDYRGIGQQFKEKLMGRGGDKWDRNSLRYKFGSVRGLAGTLGMRGDFVDNKMAVREEGKQTATRMMEANAGMENLKQFGGDKKKVEKYYEGKAKTAQAAKANLQSEEYNRNKFREAGISDEEYDRTTGGKRQNKKLAEAGQAVINTDPRMQGEKKGAFATPQPAAKEDTNSDKLNVSQEEESQTAAIQSISKPSEELVAITKAENARKAKADEALLAAITNMKAAGGGGALSSIADAASNLGGKGKMLGRAGSYLSKVGGAKNLVRGLGIGAIGAAAGSAMQWGGDKLKESGHETAGKALGAGGTAVKYAGYGAMIGSVIPGVGTAIGGAVGGVIGAGKGIYDEYIKNKPAAAVKTATKVQAAQIPAEAAVAVATKSANNEAAKFSGTLDKSPTNIVNAPTTISKQTQNSVMHVPIRDPDHSIRSYYRSRFAS
jgi:hypothetical protein